MTSTNSLSVISYLYFSSILLLSGQNIITVGSHIRFVDVCNKSFKHSPYECRYPCSMPVIGHFPTFGTADWCKMLQNQLIFTCYLRCFCYTCSSIHKFEHQGHACIHEHKLIYMIIWMLIFNCTRHPLLL